MSNKNCVNELSVIEPSIMDPIHEIFKLPICYNSKVKSISHMIENDLELIKTNDFNEEKKDDKPIYHYVFQPTNSLGQMILPQISSYYTTDISFLKDTQNLLETFKNEDINTIYNNYNYSHFDLEETVRSWKEIKEEKSFCEKYLYLDFEFIKFMNNDPRFLQCMSIYNIASPLLSLFLPIFVLIIPFFILKLKGLEINMKEYINILKLLIANHAITKIFTNFHEVDFGQKIYLFISAAFYLFSIYQNILICIKFYSNMKKIHDYLFKMKKYVAYTLQIMNYYVTLSDNLSNYTAFNSELKKHIGILNEFKNKLFQITPFTFSFMKITQIGDIMHTFYQLYDNPIYHNSILYSFGFNGYINNLYGVKNNIISGELNSTTFIEGKPTFKKMYYPKFINQKIVKNDCKLTKNIVITGPNASGKTTTLKTTIINILLSQQIGYGCFESLEMMPYDYVHCYLNIPDTSGRDSLFQAEARRCKEILDIIEQNSNERHFCIFDELYSGTNPEEAIISAFAFMDYIVKKENVTCLLTTHYIKLCKKLSKNKNIKNFNMKTIKINNMLHYTYQIKKGISKIKGGLKILSDMNYPKEILDNTKMYE